MMLEKILKRRKNDLEEKIEEEKTKYPVDKINKYIGQKLEVHYFDLDGLKIEKGTLVTKATSNGFYLSEGESRFLIHWYYKHNDGREGYVKLIKDDKGDSIYLNEDASFDYDLIHKKKSE
ncbi:MAG: hypothetical protein PWQ28_197 [Candidatus Woesearchaeota archaeon]|nr:hypothetical protein [Candidatus Woesearchaeota archaeon]